MGSRKIWYVCVFLKYLVLTTHEIIFILVTALTYIHYLIGILFFFLLFFFFGKHTDVRPPDLLKHKGINILEDKYGKTKAQLLLRWQLQRGNTMIVKSINPTRITSNADIFTWSLEL